MSTWQFDWPLNLWQTTIALIAVLMIVLFSYLRQRSALVPKPSQSSLIDGRLFALIGFRIAALACLLWMLAGLTQTKLVPTAPSIWFGVDVSASMLQADGGSESNLSRRDMSLQTIKNIEQQLKRQGSLSRVETFALGESVELSDLSKIAAMTTEDMHSSSALSDSMTALFERAKLQQPRAIYLFTDGLDTKYGSLQGQENLTELMKTDVVAFVPDLDSDNLALEIEQIDSPSLVFVGDRVQLRVRFRAEGLDGKNIRFKLRDLESQSVVAENRTQIVGSKLTDNIVFDFELESPGQRSFSLLAEYTEESVNEVKSLAAKDVSIRVREEPVRVLFIAGSYGYEVRFLKHYLERTLQSNQKQSRVFEPSFCIAGAERSLVQADDSMLPYLSVDAEWWKQFECCVLIDPGRLLLDDVVMKTFRNAIEEQGLGVIFVNGPVHGMDLWDDPQFRQLLPVEKLQRINSGMGTVIFETVASRLGLDFNSAFESFNPNTLPQLNTAFIQFSPKPTASVLAKIGSQPFLISQFVGAGQLVLQTTDETYRWRNYAGSDAIYHRYWSSMIGTVSKGSRQQTTAGVLKLESTREKSHVGDLIELRIDANGSGLNLDQVETIPILLKARDSSPIAIELTRAGSNPLYRGQFAFPQPGDYEASCGATAYSAVLPVYGLIRVMPRRSESTQEAMDIPALRQFVQSVGGRIEDWEHWKKTIDQLPSEQSLHFEALPPQSVWNYPLIVGMVILALGTEWFLRNRWGLV